MEGLTIANIANKYPTISYIYTVFRGGDHYYCYYYYWNILAGALVYYFYMDLDIWTVTGPDHKELKALKCKNM